MKKLISVLLLLTMLSGCAFLGDRSYTVVTPHDEGYQVAVDSDALTVNSYLGLKNALLRLVEDAVEEGVIRAEGYSGDLSEDLSSAVYEVSRGDPLGAFAVDYMTYDFSQIVGYYEIHVHTTYRRTLAEIESIANASGEEAVKRRLQEVMADYEPELLLRISTYRGFHMDDLVQQVYQEHPEFALELPEVEITSYPESGPSRILELHFSYRHSQETLLGYKEDMENTIRKLSALYGSKNSQLISAQRLLERLLRDAERTEEETGMASSVYGALCQGRANDFGFTQAYLQLLKSQNITCKLVKGTYLDTAHIWCQLTIDGESYFVDPARAVVVQSAEESLFPEELAEEFGYIVL